MYHATYNLHDDRLKLFIKDGPRMDREDFVEGKRIMGAYWRGSGCLTGVWTPAREDYVLSQLDEGDEIEVIIDDDAGFTYRVERFGGYSGNAGNRAEAANRAARQEVEGIPPGQPILVGHHSERGHRAALKRHDRAMRRYFDEARKADYWAQRQKAAERHAAYKERPDVIMRRIEKYQTDLRRVQRRLSGEDYRYSRSQFDSDKAYAEFIEFNQRWVDHLEMVIEYQEELYKRSGGIVAEKFEFEVGGAASYWGGLAPILKVNKKSLTLIETYHEENLGTEAAYAFTRNITFDKIDGAMSKAEVDARPKMRKRFDLMVAALQKKTKTKTENDPEKGGAVKYSYSTWGSGRASEWCEVIRVNTKTLTIQQPGYRSPTKMEKRNIVEVMSKADWEKEKAKAEQEKAAA